MHVARAAFILSLAGCALAALQNVSIDDQNGDPITGQHILYVPQSAWTFGPSCTACTAKVTPAASSFDGTWHDTSHQVGGPIVSASAIFDGTAVYVMCILTRTGVSPDGNTDMTFMLDNEIVGNFSLAPNGNPGYMFDVPVYSNANLKPGLHNITLLSGFAGGKSLVLLDRIIYTTDASQSNDPSSQSQAPPPSPSPASHTTSVTSTSSQTSTLRAATSSTLSLPTLANLPPPSTINFAQTTASTTSASSDAPQKKIRMGAILVASIPLLLCFI